VEPVGQVAARTAGRREVPGVDEAEVAVEAGGAKVGGDGGVTRAEIEDARPRGQRRRRLHSQTLGQRRAVTAGSWRIHPGRATTRSRRHGSGAVGVDMLASVSG
jgi:hypothetical protein